MLAITVLLKRTVITETDVALARRKAQSDTRTGCQTSRCFLRRHSNLGNKVLEDLQGQQASLIRLFIVDPQFVKESLA